MLFARSVVNVLGMQARRHKGIASKPLKLEAPAETGGGSTEMHPFGDVTH